MTNTGNVPLSGVWVDDDMLVANPVLQAKTATTGDLDDDGLLDLDEVWIYTATGVATANDPASAYENTGTAYGTGPADDEVEDSDDSSYTGSDPAIQVVKYVGFKDASDVWHWFDANDATGAPEVLEDTVIAWKYEVTNTGNVNLTEVDVSDDIVGYVGTVGLLEPGAANMETLYVYEKSPGEPYTAEAGGYANIGTATGTPPVGDDVSDTDPAHYFGVHAEIAIVKKTNGADANSATGPYIKVGDPVTWTYEVTNMSNVTLSDPVVTDDMGATPVYDSGDDGDGDFEPGETWVYEAADTAEPGQYANIGTATADFTDDAGQLAQPSDTDPSHYYGADPQIAIDKTTKGCDGEFDDGVFVEWPGQVTWKYVVTNPGNVPLSGVWVDDDMLTANPVLQAVDETTTPKTGDLNANSKLDTNETWIFKATGTAVKGDYDNKGTATGTPPAPLANVSAWNTSSYFGVDLAIDVEKDVRINTGTWQPADDPTGPSAIVLKDEVYFRFVVTNTGNVDLTSVQLTDNKYAAELAGATLPNGDPIPTSLAAGDSFTVIIGPFPAEFGQQANKADVRGYFESCDKTATDFDWAYYNGAYGALTPGYWKNHGSVWTSPTYKEKTGWTAPYYTSMLVKQVFLVDNSIVWTQLSGRKVKTKLGDFTLIQALGFAGDETLGGGAQILLRAAVAAVLNAQADYNDANGGWFTYPIPVSEIISRTDIALASLNRAQMITLAAELDGYNNGH